jgi:hypothetical protein
MPSPYRHPDDRGDGDRVTAQSVQVRPGSYHDSVTLMRVGRALSGLDGVLAAQTAMATELNLELLTAQGFDVPETAGPNDLVVAVRAVDDAALDSALASLTSLPALLVIFRRPRGASASRYRAVRPRLPQHARLARPSR